MVDIILSVTYFAILLGFGVLIANVLRKARIPDAFFLLLLGLLLGPTFFMNPYIAKFVSLNLVDVSAMGAIPDFLRMLALILVVFTSTFNLGFRVFKRLGNTSIKLAFFGVIFNTIFLGVAAQYIFGFDWVYSFLFAAVLSGTGAAVIFAFENTLKHSKKMLNILKVESIFNTPLGILLPVLFLDLVKIEPGALLEPMKYLSQFWLMIAAGVGTGILIGIFVSKVMKDMLKEYSVLFMFSIALVTFALAENIGGSGMLAVAVCGLIAGDLVFTEKKEVKHFDDHLSELFRISVFTLLGAQVMLSLTIQDIQTVLIFFLIMFFSRPLFLVPLLGKERKDFSKRDILFLSFVAPRGLPAAAMAPIVAAALITAGQATIASSIVNIIFLVVLLSVLFSTLSATILGHFGMTRKADIKSKEEKEMENLEDKTEKQKASSEEKVLEGVENNL
jgi:cell volume regulation protein A